MPTVVSPEVYRRRFLEAMDKYFLFVPDKWNGLGKDFKTVREFFLVIPYSPIRYITMRTLYSTAFWIKLCSFYVQL